MEQVMHEQSRPRMKTGKRMRRRRDDTGRFCAVPTTLLVLFIVIPLVALI
jgi:hypothetical protein